MRRPAALSAYLLGLLALFGCQTPPPPPQPILAMDSGIVVASIRLNLPKRFLRFGAQDADRVFMYRIEGNATPYTPGPVVWSDGIFDGHAVFLEVPPGRYAIAGAGLLIKNTMTSMAPGGSIGPVGFSVGMSLTTVTPVNAYFPDELVRSLSVEVTAGGVAAVGEVEVDLGSIRALDDAQRHAYRRVASKARSGLARHDYSATVRRVDQSPARIEAISENVRSELSHAGWRWPDPTGPSTLAALDYFVPASFRPGAPLAAVSLRVVDDVGSETSAENVNSFERVLAFELVEAGFEVGKDPADLTIDVEVEELTAGSRGQRIVSFRHGHAILSYTVTVSRPSGEVLGRSDGARRLGDKLFARDNPDIMSSASITELLIAQSAGDIVDYAQILHEFPAEAIARWLNRPAIQIVLKDQVGTEYSAAGSADLEEMLAEDLRGAGYRLGGGGDALTLEVDIVKYEPGSRAKRLTIPGWGASRLAYEATVLDASGSVLGRTEGRKRYTGFEITDNPELKSHRQLRVDMADHCAAQISEYVQQTIPVAAASHISGAP